jgi:hypothetical protein
MGRALGDCRQLPFLTHRLGTRGNHEPLVFVAEYLERLMETGEAGAYRILRQ